MEKDVVVSLWNASAVSQIPMGYFIWENGFWTVDWRNIHYWDKDSFVYMDLDYLANHHKWCTYFSVWSQDTINFWYSTILQVEALIGDVIHSIPSNRYLILNELSEMRSILNFASRSAGRIHSILKEQSETPSLSDTQGIIGDAMDTQGVDHASDIEYSRSWSREWYWIHNKLWAKKALIGNAIDTQGTGDVIYIWYSTAQCCDRS